MPMKILKIDPGKKPETMDIENSLESMQSLVGGMIQAVYPFDDPIALICNDEGKILNLPLNRVLRNPENGEIYDIICGTMFLCGAPADSDHFTDLSPEEIVRYEAYYQNPEFFIKSDNGFTILK